MPSPSATLAAALTAAFAVFASLAPAAPATAPSSAPSSVQDTSTSTDTATSPAVTKLLTFVVENHSLAQMQASMPYTSSLAHTYGYASHYSAVTHPSLPNYLAIAGGSTYGVHDDDPPSHHRLPGRSVFGQALRHHKTAKVYVDGMPSSCALRDGGRRYAVKHNPWAYFAAPSERAACRRFDVPVSRMQADIDHGTLPNVGMVVPNLCHDAHDCSLRTADAWFKTRMVALMAGPDWQAGRLAVVLTADEDDRHSGNRVLTVVVHPSQQGRVVTTSLTHYSLTRLYSQVAGTSHWLRKAGSAPDLRAAFDLPLP